MKPFSRCKAVMIHLAINLLTYNICLFVVLKNTATNFDYTEWSTLASMLMVSCALAVLQYDIWKIRHDRYIRRVVKFDRRDIKKGVLEEIK